MTLPRDVVPGRFYMITRRCTRREFLLRPNDETNNAYAYCLGLAMQRFENMAVILTCQMSNHHHTVVFDRDGEYPAFMEHFHRMVARCMNVHLGRDENFWSSQQACVVQLVDIDAIFDKLAYTATNPVKSNLVATVEDWPGINTYTNLLEDTPIIATRPGFFFRQGDKALPERIEVRMKLPPELGERAPFLAELRARVDGLVQHFAAERRKQRIGVLGRARVLAQDCFGHSRPRRPRPDRNGIRPRVATRNRWAREEALARNKVFEFLHAVARRALKHGFQPTFPLGTYYLPRYVNVRVRKLATDAVMHADA
ncbi:MAG TPA: hypothetical protein VFQ53_17470 [Kofleriaceae bacterium]|nr:hypothetical protein [Kofleriaceae bacterium]